MTLEDELLTEVEFVSVKCCIDWMDSERNEKDVELGGSEVTMPVAEVMKSSGT